MELRLFNTLTKEKEVFAPLDPARGVRMYVCGPTVYDFAHIGNARPVIVFDVLFRLLRHLYGEGSVKYVRNITDVDDKINARAATEYPDLPLNEAIRLVTEKTEQQFHDDVAALGCLPPTVEPRATEHIAEMRELIDRLVKAGFAYVEQGHVLFEVGKMADYGKLARRSLDEMEAGARVEVAPYKRNPMDFVLWKPSKPNEPGWPSPSGIKVPGRPGWHIECSAMSWKHLGETFDIHGGGIDLVFPHHENEIAQSRCAFHAPVMAKIWMHNGFLQVEGEKMSKSLGNFITIRDVLKTPMAALVPIANEKASVPVSPDWITRWNGLCARYAMLQTQYREPLDWTARRFKEAGDELYRFYEALRETSYDPNHTARTPADDFVRALSEDLNTPAAITQLRAYAKSGSTSDLGWSMSLMGLLDSEFVTRDDLILFNRAALPEDTKKHIDDLVKRRDEVRSRKDWKESDRIRDELKAMGVVIKDNKDGTTSWEIAR
ncbi:MAG: cysteine--tRNA ligase [Rhizobiales bacterium]|nr:cysteine--tRNA ligase [Hyphomicrobiales bacterium]